MLVVAAAAAPTAHSSERRHGLVCAEAADTAAMTMMTPRLTRIWVRAAAAAAAEVVLVLADYDVCDGSDCGDCFERPGGELCSNCSLGCVVVVVVVLLLKLDIADDGAYLGRPHPS